MGEEKDSLKERAPDTENIEKLERALLKHFDWLEEKIKFYSDDESKVQSLINAEQRLAKSIIDCASLSRDPKFRISEDEAEGDLALMVERVRSAKECSNSERERRSKIGGNYDGKI